MDEPGLMSQRELKYLRRYRKDALDMKRYAEKFIDQTVTTLTVGLLGFTLAFKDLISVNEANSTFFSAGLISLGLAVGLVLLNTLISIIAARKLVKEVDNALIDGSSESFNRFRKPRLSTIITCTLNLLICLAFALGLFFLLKMVIIAL